MDVSLSAYERSQHLFPGHGCLTWIRTGATDDAFAGLVRGIGGGPATARPATWEDAEGEAYDDLADDILLAGRHGFGAAPAVGGELSGVRVDGSWLRREHLCVQLRPLPPRPVTPEDLLDADMRAVAGRDPRIAAIAADPVPGRLPAGPEPAGGGPSRHQPAG
ncbi:hypothetical protein AB0C28_54745 [Nonomuraea sp. NPDC048892]|uniref:hypothetical protein n=1 Tax=Nonomuraea sp. NPDC048892 TaxID=3154624 RepID=UPI0033EF9CA0